MHLLFVDKLFSAEFVRALCWTLLHSIWQSLVLAIIAGTVVILARKSKPVLRYNILSFLFFTYLLVVALTFVNQWQQVRTSDELALVQPAPDTFTIQPEATAPAQIAEPGFISKFVGYFNEHASLVVTIWFIIFCALFVRMLANIAWVQRIKHYRNHQPPAEWKEKVRQIAERLEIRRVVTLLQSELAKVPMVVGIFKPVIIIPIGLLTNLPAEEVESILAHELAHIRRRDYFINLVQIFAETTLFFNPAMLWVSSLIRQEREVCCDELAIEGSGSKATYINALVSFQEYYLGKYAPGTALAFPGQKNHLLNRVKRLVMKDNKNLNYLEKITMVCSIALITSVIIFSTTKLFAQEKNSTASKQSQTSTAGRDSLPNSKTQSTEIKFPDLTQGDEENYLNTVTTTDKDGNKYKFVSIGDRVPKLYVNDELVPRKRMEKYADLTRKLLEELWQRQKEYAKQVEDGMDSDAAWYSQKISEIASDLVREQLIQSKEQISSFRLTSNEFVVNNQKQQYEVFNRYKSKYIRYSYDVFKFTGLSK